MAMKVFLSVAVVCMLVTSSLCDNWAFLIRGSAGYENYRHEADIFHAYHVLRDHGIPEENIVVMMDEDIAQNPSNPFKGNVINHPNGTNVYPGVKVDYNGINDMDTDILLMVLQGQEKAVEKRLGRKVKVIKSGPEDNVFVYFADHGAPGFVSLLLEELEAKQLNDVIETMYKRKQYKEMVLYIEACDSGTMFEKFLRKDINVYAVTSANTHESSYATYWDPVRKAYLGDFFSVNWMEDSDVEDLNKETIGDQFDLVRKETNASHVMEYGDLSIRSRTLGNFQGNLSDAIFKIRQEKRDRVKSGADATIALRHRDAIPSEYVPIESLRRRAETAEGEERVRLEKAYRVLLWRNKETIEFFQLVVRTASIYEPNYRQLLKTEVQFTDLQCYRESRKIVKGACPGLKLLQNYIALRNVGVLAILCESGLPKQRVLYAIQLVSSQSPICTDIASL